MKIEKQDLQDLDDGLKDNCDFQLKQMVSELASQKVFFNEILDTLPDLIFYKDLNSVFLGCNRAFATTIFGLTKEEIIGKTDFELLDAEAASFYRQKDLETLAAGKALKYEDQIALSDGRVIDIETVKTPFWDEQGNVAGLIGVGREITERKVLEKQLRVKAEYAELLFKTVPSAVLSVDKDGKIMRWNKIAEEITGYAAAEVIGKECAQMLHGVCRDDCKLCSRASDAPLMNESCKILCKDGQIRHVLKSIAVLKDEFGQISEKMECFEDITDMINLEDELRESKEGYAAIVNNAPQFVVIHNNGILKFVNDAGKEAMGYGENYIGRHIKEFVTENSMTLINLALSDKAKGTADVPYEIELIKQCGGIINVLLKGTEISFKGKKAILAVMIDITESKQLSAKLQASEEKLRAQEHQTYKELILAARVQRNSLPHSFVGEEVQVSTIFEPYSLVSGDFFNYKWFEDQKMLCGYIMDVTGHGVATALQTATFKMMLDNVLLNGEKIEKGALQRINQSIKQYVYEDSFLALLYFEFDLKAAVLKVISAGITLFLAAKPQECSLVPISGCYLGIIDDPEIEMVRIPLKAGEIYCMMSDGVSDLIELHGTKRQESFANYKNWLESLAGSPDRNDDFSVVCVEILQETKEAIVIEINNDGDLKLAQGDISDFLERNASIHSLILEVAINEAVNNGYCVSGRVCVKLRRVGGKLIIRVKDDGPGFNTERMNDHRKSEGNDDEFDELLAEEGGRGILLMRILCDKVTYNAKGNEVLLMKKI